MSISIGVDPGVSKGAIAVFDGTLLDSFAISHDIKGLNRFVGTLPPAKVFLEDIHSIGGTSKSSMFTMGRGVGWLEGILEAWGFEVVNVEPRIWQTAVWEESDYVFIGKKRDTKATSLNAAKRLFPGIDLRYANNEVKKRPARTVDHNGLIDALLIAYYGSRI